MFQCVDIGWDTFWDTFGTKSVTETLTKKWNEAGGTNTCHRVSCPVHRFIIIIHTWGGIQQLDATQANFEFVVRLLHDFIERQL